MSTVSTEPITQEVEAKAEAKILHLLRIYPLISPTMLQAGLGPYVKPGIWRPVLRRLIEQGVVREEKEELLTPDERYNTYTKLSLAGDA